MREPEARRRHAEIYEGAVGLYFTMRLRLILERAFTEPLEESQITNELIGVIRENIRQISPDIMMVAFEKLEARIFSADSLIGKFCVTGEEGATVISNFIDILRYTLQNIEAIAAAADDIELTRERLRENLVEMGILRIKDEELQC